MATTLRDLKIEHYKEQFGYDIVQKVADEIRTRSQRLAEECIFADEKMSRDFGRKIVHLREEKLTNRTCRRMIFQGPSTSKYFQGQWFSHKVIFRFCYVDLFYNKLEKPV